MLSVTVTFRRFADETEKLKCELTEKLSLDQAHDIYRNHPNLQKYVHIDIAQFDDYASKFAVILTEGICEIEKIGGIDEIPKILIEAENHIVLPSVFGNWVWGKTKDKLFEQRLEFPNLTYSRPFRDNFPRLSTDNRKLLQEKLMDISRDFRRKFNRDLLPDDKKALQEELIESATDLESESGRLFRGLPQTIRNSLSEKLLEIAADLDMETPLLIGPIIATNGQGELTVDGFTIKCSGIQNNMIKSTRFQLITKRDTMRFVLSTVGTSILTNLIDNKNSTEAAWRNTLRDSANVKQDKLEPETEKVINTLTERALAKLMEDDAETNCRISAELNGIYGIYGGQLPIESRDEHYLVCTDTAQGQKTGGLIRDFLESQGFTVGVVTPSRLSTQDPESFTTGTKELIKWLEDNVPWRRERDYRVIFNLVGGFKSLQGYMNTFGAFYADEVVYIFEAPTADLIKIPRLPIQINTTVIERYLTEFALMDAGKLYPLEELEGISETLLELVEENGKTYAGLSAWGELLWHRTKSDLLSGNLLPFPRLVYQQSFIRDCKGLNDQQWTKLQETLAKVAAALESSSGDIRRLNNQVSGLNFEQLTNLTNICTFRITRGIRVSCEIAGDGLTLRHYGNHDDIYDNP